MSSRSDILRHLEPVGSPLAAPRVAKAPRRGLDQADFHSLISSAQNDSRRTNRPVTLANQIELSTQQQSRLERAADAALAHDARTALVLLDGRPLLLDVQSREVTEEVAADGKSDRVVTDIDTLIVSRDESTADGEPAHSLMLRRLSGAARTTTISGLLNDERPASTSPRTQDIGQ